MRDAAELQTLGRDAINAGRLSRGRRLLTQALERDPSDDVRARCLISLSMVDSEQGHLGAGIATCSQALGIPGIGRDVRGLAHSQLGLLRIRAGDTAGALDELGQAERLIEDRAALARLYLNRGSIHVFLDRPRSAAADFERALDLADAPVTRAKAQHNLANVELVLGDPVQALRLMERADAVLDEEVPALRIVNQHDRALAVSACGMPVEAAGLLAVCARAYARAGQRQDQAEAQLERARILLLIDPSASLRAARHAARLFERRESADWALRARAAELAAEAACERRLASLSERADRLCHDLLERRLRADAQQVSLWAARAALTRSAADEARQWLGRAHVRSRDPLPSRLLASELRGGLASLSGHPGRALHHLRRGLDELHSWVSKYGSHDLQSSAAGHGRGLTRLGLALAVDDGRPALVFEWAERSRVLNSRVSPARPPVGAADELRELRGRERDASSDHARLRDRIRQHGWYTEASGPAAQPADLSAVQAALAGGDALVSLMVAQRDVVALVVTAAEAEIVPIAPLDQVQAQLPRLVADLETAAGEDLPDSILGVVRHSLDQRLSELGSLLFGPIQPRWGDPGRVVLVPTGRVNGVPWTLLPQLRGRSVTVARSATHWLSLQARDLPTARVGFARGPRLPHARAEIVAAARSWPGARIELHATAQSIAALAEGVDVLHVAAHGHHEGDSPMFSGLEMFDGHWYGYDIDQLTRVPDVVILSACEVGAATVRAHEYLIGLTTAWLHAGAQCVIASPMAVNDRTAATMLPVVHARLAAGESPAAALAAALGATDHPPAFACYGRGW